MEINIFPVKLDQIEDTIIKPVSVRTRQNEQIFLQSLLKYGQLRPLVVMRSPLSSESGDFYCIVDGYKMLTLLKQIGYRTFSATLASEEVATPDRVIKAHLQINLSDGEVDLLKLVSYVAELAKIYNVSQIATVLCMDEERVKLLQRMQDFDWEAFADKSANVNQTSLF
jgi:hypothetical protein